MPPGFFRPGRTGGLGLAIATAAINAANSRAPASSTHQVVGVERLSQPGDVGFDHAAGVAQLRGRGRAGEAPSPTGAARPSGKTGRSCEWTHEFRPVHLSDPHCGRYGGRVTERPEREAGTRRAGST